MTKNLVKYIFAFTIISALISWSFVPDLVVRYRFFHVNRAIAVGVYPQQLGLTGVSLTNCTISCDGGCCTGGSLCSSLTVNDCPKTQEVSGGMSGGTGTMALFAIEDIGMAGVSNGGDLIAGMTVITQPKNNVCLAGQGGCTGSCCSYTSHRSDGLH